MFRIAGVDAAQAEFPPQPGNGTYFAWGTPAFYRAHPALSGFVQVALRLRDGSRDWPAVRRELGRGTHGKLPQAELLAAQSVNTERSIRPQAVALWLLAALFGAIGLLILGQLLARLTFLEAAEFGTWRALGMSRVQLLAASLARAAVIGVAGGVAAVAAAVAFSPLLPVGLARVAEPHPGIDADVLVLAGGAAAAIVVTVTLTAWPGWRAAAQGPLALASRCGGRARPGRAGIPGLPGSGGRAGPAGHGPAVRPAPGGGRAGGAGAQRNRQRHRGRGCAQRGDRVRRKPQLPARLAGALRRHLGRHAQ